MVSPRGAETVLISLFCEPLVLDAVPGPEKAPGMVLRKREGNVSQGPGSAPQGSRPPRFSHCSRLKYKGRQVLGFPFYRRRSGSLEGLSNSQHHPAHGCGPRHAWLAFFLYPGLGPSLGPDLPRVCTSSRMMTGKQPNTAGWQMRGVWRTQLSVTWEIKKRFSFEKKIARNREWI